MEDKIIQVGIFWAVPDEKGGQSVLHRSKRCELGEADSLGFINYRYSHFEIWDYLRGKRTEDCYRYPRGRVLFDVKADKHVIYADRCISDEAIKKVVELFEIEGYELRGDEHYVCPKCQKKKGDKL